jgi:hypothetical protein
MIERLKSSRKPSVLGLAPEGSRIEVVPVRRTNGSAEAAPPVVIDLGGDLVDSDIVILAKRLRDGLDAAGIRERRCAVALPPNWIFALSVPLPELAPEDLESFLELEAERGFPYGPDQLAIARAEWQAAEGGANASLVAVPRENILRLEQILRLARLQPVSFAPALTELPHCTAPVDGVRLDLLASGGEVGLLVANGPGLIVHRFLEGVVSLDAGAPRIIPEVLARELRVSLGQLPAGVRELLKVVRVLGAGPLADELAAAVQARASTLRVRVERVDRLVTGYPAVPRMAAGMPLSPALAVAARFVSGEAASFEFLPPKVSALQQFAARYSSGRLMHVGIAAGAIAALVLGAFLFQQFRLMRLQSEWDGMSKDVREIEDTQAQLKKFRPWFDESVRSLLVMKTLTESFPEDGAVTAKNVEIRDVGVVVCQGTAKDSTALLRTLDKLRAAREVTDVQVDQLRGKSPLQFTFNFRWDVGGRQP